MKYIVLGVIAPNGSNKAIAGQDSYLTSNSADWFVWEGGHATHATRFITPELALAAAQSCRGPIFSMPDPISIHVIKSEE